MKPLMKISLVAASLLAITLSSSAQQNESFKVVKVQGEIHRVKTAFLDEAEAPVRILPIKPTRRLNTNL